MLLQRQNVYSCKPQGVDCDNSMRYRQNVYQRHLHAGGKLITDIIVLCGQRGLQERRRSLATIQWQSHPRRDDNTKDAVLLDSTVRTMLLIMFAICVERRAEIT